MLAGPNDVGRPARKPKRDRPSAVGSGARDLLDPMPGGPAPTIRAMEDDYIELDFSDVDAPKTEAEVDAAYMENRIACEGLDAEVLAEAESLLGL